MENAALDLIDALYNMIAEARSLPLGNDKCILDRDAALNLLDDLKASLPTEMGEARRLVNARSEFVESAKQEADSIRRAAEEKARDMVKGEMVYKMACEQADEIIKTAEDKSREVKKAAGNYLEEALRSTEESISAALEGVRTARSQFRAVNLVEPEGTADVSMSDIEEENLL